MHGRLKVKTTAQQEAEKKKERAVKLAGYRHAMAAILARRRDGQQDEKQLQLTAQVLTVNPDIHTLWNIRRECVHALVSGQVSAQAVRRSSSITCDLGTGRRREAGGGGGGG